MPVVDHTAHDAAIILVACPIVLTLALTMTLIDHLRSRKQATTPGAGGSRSPLLRRKRFSRVLRDKGKRKWWHILRMNKRPSIPDEEYGFPTSRNRLNHSRGNSVVLPHYGTTDHAQTDDRRYGTIDIFADFDGTHPAAQAPGPAASEDDDYDLPWSRAPDYFDDIPRMRTARGMLSSTSTAAPLESLPVAPALPSDATIHPRSRISADTDSFADDFELIRTFTYGAVHLVRRRSDGMKFVIKQVGLRTKGDAWLLPTEVELPLNILHQSHSNIIDLETFTQHHGRDGSSPFANIVVEYCDAGDVNNFLEYTKKRGQQVPRQFILHFISSMIDALAFLHFGDTDYNPTTDTVTSIAHRQPCVLHRDIKPMNIFMKWTSNPETTYGMPKIKLADLGLSATEAKNVGAHGTEGYMAPEVADVFERAQWDGNMVDQVYHGPRICWKESDMYSFGMSLYEMLSLNLRHDNNISSADVSAAFDNSTVSNIPEIGTLLSGCLQKSKTDRPQINRFHKLSATCKAELQLWYDNGGSLPECTWPNPMDYDNSVRQRFGMSLPAPASTTSSSSFGSISPTMVAELDGMHPLRRVGHISIALDVRRSSDALPGATTGESMRVAIDRPASHIANVTRDTDGVQTIELSPIPDAVPEPASAFSWDSTPTDGGASPASPHLGWF